MYLGYQLVVCVFVSTLYALCLSVICMYVCTLLSTSLSLQIGEMCAVQFSEDSLWYRGQIIAVHGDQVQVLFIDYGNEENKRGNEVRESI